METIKEKILKTIQKQSLSFAELKNWRVVLENIPENLCVDILEFIENNPEGLRILTDNLNEKVEALEKKDIKKWEEILEKEKQLFQIKKI